MEGVLKLSLLLGFIATFSSQVSGSGSSSGKSKNPAEELAIVINQNRTASKLPQLYNNPGLACMALQYIQAYDGKCSKVGPDGERPADEEFTSSFAESCGVSPKSVSKITGIILGCQTDFKDATFAFSNLLFKEAETLKTLQNKNQTEFGVGISGYQGGSPYFWCVLFSRGSNTTFTFEQGTAKVQKTGCFSGTGDPCSHGFSVKTYGTQLLVFLVGMISYVICGL